MRVAVIGAGLSGLATAFYLQRARPDAELVILESEPWAGGKLRTVEIGGFRFETGANGFLDSKPDCLQLVEDCGSASLLMASNELARKRYVYTNALHRLPESPPAFLKSKLLTFPQKLRVFGEVLVPARRDGVDETLREFGDRRLGKAFTDIFLDAMTAGVSGSTPERISVRAAFPLVADLEQQHGGLFRGMLARRRREAGPRGVLTSFRGGVGTFIEHLRTTIRAEWRFGEEVHGVERVGHGYALRTPGGTVAADVVAVCATSYAASTMLAALDSELAQRLAAIQYTPISVVGFGFRSLPQPLDGFGVLTTKSAQQPVLGILWDSSIFPDRAPTGAKSLRVMIGGLRNPGLALQDEAGLIASAREGLRNVLGITIEPDVQFVQRWARGIPNYPPGHIENVDAIFARVAQHPGLYLNCNAYRGIAMNECVRHGRETGEGIAERQNHVFDTAR